MTVAYRAHDGSSGVLSRSSFDSLSDFVEECGRQLDIPSDCVIAFFAGNGDQIRDENVIEIGSEGRDEIIAFSREVLQAEPDELAPALHVKLALPAAPSHISVETLDDLIKPLEPLLASLRIQHTALHIATLNLMLHFTHLSSAYSNFLPIIEREISRQRILLRGYDASIWIVGRVSVKEDVGGVSRKKEGTQRMLREFISLAKMGMVKDGCESAHAGLVARFEAVKATMEDLMLGVNEVQSAADGFGLEEAEECWRVAERALSRARDIADAGMSGGSVMQDGLRELRDLDLLIRQKIELLLEVKNSFSTHMIHILRSISQLQSTIAALPSSLSSLESELRTVGGFTHLARLSSMPGAYGRLLIEGVRRKEFARFFLDRSQRLAETMAKLISAERKRREAYRVEVQCQLPWDTKTMDGAPPQLELSTIGGGGEEELSLNRSDVEDFFHLLDTLQVDPELLALVAGGEPNPITTLRASLVKQLSKLDQLSAEFERVAEKTLFSESRAISHRNLSADTGRIQALELELAARTTQLKEVQDQAAHLQAELDEAHDVLAHQTDKVTELTDQVSSATAKATAAEEALRALRTDSDVQLADLRRERGVHLRELGQAQMRAQDAESQLSSARSQARTANQALADAKIGHEAELRDQVAEAQGDRAFLEQQIAECKAALKSAQTEAAAETNRLRSESSQALEAARAESETALKAAQDKGTRAIDSVKAELKMQRVQLRDALAQRKAALEDATQKTQREKDLEAAALEAVRLAKIFRDVDERLMETLRSSSLASSLTLLSSKSTEPAKPVVVTSSPPPETAANFAQAALLHAEDLAALSSYDLKLFEDTVLKTMKLVTKWIKKSLDYKENARGKIATSHFSPGDLALFLPTRDFSSAVRPWAAFNVNFPHFFLNTTPALAEHLLTREYHIARITTITEKVVDAHTLSSLNNVGLPLGTTYFILDTDDASARPPPKLRVRRTVSMTGGEPSSATGITSSGHRKSSSPLTRRSTSTSLTPLVDDHDSGEASPTLPPASHRSQSTPAAPLASSPTTKSGLAISPSRTDLVPVGSISPPPATNGGGSLFGRFTPPSAFSAAQQGLLQAKLTGLKPVETSTSTGSTTNDGSQPASPSPEVDPGASSLSAASSTGNGTLPVVVSRPSSLSSAANIGGPYSHSPGLLSSYPSSFTRHCSTATVHQRPASVGSSSSLRSTLSSAAGAGAAPTVLAGKSAPAPATTSSADVSARATFVIGAGSGADGSRSASPRLKQPSAGSSKGSSGESKLA